MLALFSMPYGSDAYSCFIFQIRFKLQQRKLEAGTHRNNSCFYCISIHTSMHTLSLGKLLWNVEHILVFMTDFKYFHYYYDYFGFFVFKLNTGLLFVSRNSYFCKINLCFWTLKNFRAGAKFTFEDSRKEKSYSLDSLEGGRLKHRC